MHAQLLNMAYTVSRYEKPARIWLCKDCSENEVGVTHVKDLMDKHVCMICGTYEDVNLYEKIRG